MRFVSNEKFTVNLKVDYGAESSRFQVQKLIILVLG